jgi:hypothetical protein
MENRNSRTASTRTSSPFPSSFALRISTFISPCPLFAPRVWLFALFFVAGCGAPGEPTAPSPPIPSAITDLSARQAGDGVQLMFTMPLRTTRGERLTQPPAIEILRGSPKPDGSPDAKSLHVVDTIPGALAGKYQLEDHIQVISPIAPEETRAHPGLPIIYSVRTRAAKKRASTDSNIVAVRAFPVPERISSIESRATQSSIHLRWAAPTLTAVGEPIAVTEYHVYRGELDPRAHDPATKDVLHEKWIVPFNMVGRSDIASYQDTQFDFGKTYVYVVRSVTTVDGTPLESSDSEPLVLTPVDTFAPATPQGVTAAVVTNPDGGRTEVDLSWSLGAEPDLAGYRVYRSEQPETRGQPVTIDLLPSPAYRDTSVASGHQYWYRVTAVDRSGNESESSPPVAADVTQHPS